MWKKLYLYWKTLERWQRMLAIAIFWIFSIIITAFIPTPWNYVFSIIAGSTSGIVWAFGLD